jgi:hypothetical protein
MLALPGLGMDDTCLMVGFVWPFGTPFEFSVTLFIILFI